MSQFQAFFAQNAVIDTTEEFVVSERFKDKEGNPIPWQLRSITEDHNTEIRKASTKRIKGKNGSYSVETNQEEYVARLVTASVVYPELKDPELQKSYNTVGAESLLRKMLLPGEFGVLLKKVQELNGFDRDMSELVDEVKN
ncbi:phage portal protein [Paenibacillus sp. GCM10012307]|uniref:Phage portal protein n=1 Tax=Paenibacillus roseus TaxID=2798579 RepID=A0A934J411_9BACL|nr:phage portal protein [Paenibacillus roseus]MBJ6360426.1 phage portal protein [Paenibacillus roseus]